MTDGFDTSGGNIVVTYGGVEKFSTAKKQFNRVPLGQILLGSPTTPYTITFPAMDKTYAYKYATYHDSVTGNNAEQCTSTGRLAQQEWGPAALGFSSPHLLDDIDLGAAPAGCDFLDVQVNLTRTTSPTDPSWSFPVWNQWAWPIEIAEGQWLPLTDAALVIERLNNFSRMFWFEIVSGRMLLRRKQSVSSAQFEHGLLMQSNGSAFKTNDPGLNQLDSSHLNGTGCTSNNTLNSLSVYSGQIRIVPCSTS